MLSQYGVRTFAKTDLNTSSTAACWWYKNPSDDFEGLHINWRVMFQERDSGESCQRSPPWWKTSWPLPSVSQPPLLSFPLFVTSTVMCSSLLLCVSLAKLFLSCKQSWARVSHNFCCCYSALPYSSSSSSSSSSSLAVSGPVTGMRTLLFRRFKAKWTRSKSQSELIMSQPVKDWSDRLPCLLAVSPQNITEVNRT